MFPVFLISLTLIAFAANSVFCRLALIDLNNSPTSFTLIRLLSGSTILFFFFIKDRKLTPLDFNIKTLSGPLFLFLYALFFSLAYVQIDAGAGALILFATVQITMMSASFLRGQTLSKAEVLGFGLAIFGFLYLMLPGSTAPPLKAAVLMTISGLGWGLYSLLGQTTKHPVLITSRNFVLTTPVCFLLLASLGITLTTKGFIFAILSGALTSGLGYVLWYKVLKEISISTAAIVQLSVPALAALGGVLFLNESLSLRMIIASALIFSGIYIKSKTV